MTSSEPTGSGTALEAPLSLVTEGRHQLSHRAVGQDGHVTAGDLWFTVAAEGLPLPSAAAAQHVPASRPAAADADDRGLPSRFTAAVWLAGAALGLGGLIALVGLNRDSKVAVRARRGDG